jgi:hypothetical protein
VSMGGEVRWDAWGRVGSMWVSWVGLEIEAPMREVLHFSEHKSRAVGTQTPPLSPIIHLRLLPVLAWHLLLSSEAMVCRLCSQGDSVAPSCSSPAATRINPGGGC